MRPRAMEAFSAWVCEAIRMAEAVIGDPRMG